MDNIKVLVVDDNAVLRMGLTHAIDNADGFQIVGEAANAEDALISYEKYRPDVVTMDYQMPGIDGVETTRRLIKTDPDAKIVLLTVKEAEEDVWNAVQAGCKGYLTKRAGEVEDVLQAINEVANGNTYFPAKVASKIESRLAHEALTPRELEVLQGLAKGYSNKEIMDELDISEGTVKLHLSNLRKKLNAADRTQALITAVQRGIVQISSNEE
ncbi:MAG: response regulator [Pontiellaceae bacterium]